ncbi:Peptidyl-prolyl cis-trans isomerase fpr2 [Sorochytrium milnesiophthora]
MKVLLFLLVLAAITVSVHAEADKGKQQKKKRSPPTELRIGVLERVECTRKSRDGDKLSMHYTGTLFDTGAKFDSSHDRNQPFDFTLGQGMVIKGWDHGLRGMCEGEKRRLTIPSDLGYGDSGSPPVIPPKAALVFEVELLKIHSKEEL